MVDRGEQEAVMEMEKSLSGEIWIFLSQVKVPMVNSLPWSPASGVCCQRSPSRWTEGQNPQSNN